MKYVLAPLADFTDAPFRLMCGAGGADMTYTEMVSAAALQHGHVPTRTMMETMPGEKPVACQVFGSEEVELAHAAREVSGLRGLDGGPRFAEINLNAGCPMPRIVRSGSGAALVSDPGRVFRLLKAMKEQTDLPVTLKTRLGPHRNNPTVFELLDAAQSAGASGIIVHARSVGQKHGGPVDLGLLAEVVRRAKIPVTGNGSVVDAETAAAMAAAGVSSIMVGRAALPDPGVFARIKGERRPHADWARLHLAAILEFRRLLAERFPGGRVPDEDSFASLKARTHLFRYFSGRPGAAALRARMNSVRTLADVEAAFSMMDGQPQAPVETSNELGGES